MPCFIKEFLEKMKATVLFFSLEDVYLLTFLLLIELPFLGTDLFFFRMVLMGHGSYCIYVLGKF